MDTGDEWVEEGPYRLAPEVRVIAAGLIRDCPELSHLANRNIGYLWRAGQVSWVGKARLVPALYRLLSGFEAVVEMNLAVRSRAPGELEALVYHELYHLGRDEQGRLVMREHDIGEFSAVVRRYGTYRPELHEFATQLTLFALPAAAEVRT